VANSCEHGNETSGSVRSEECLDWAIDPEDEGSMTPQNVGNSPTSTRSNRSRNEQPWKLKISNYLATSQRNLCFFSTLFNDVLSPAAVCSKWMRSSTFTFSHRTFLKQRTKNCIQMDTQIKPQGLLPS
jgi:hypothetical protein